MLSPEPMRHLALVALSPDLEAATRSIARVGVLHLLNVRHSAGTTGMIRPYEVGQELTTLDRLERGIDDLLTFFDAAAAESALSGDAADGVDMSQVDARLAVLRGEVDALRHRLARAADEAEQLRNLLRNLRALAPVGVPLDQLHQLRYVCLSSGLLPAGNLPRLRDSLARLPHLILPAGAPAADGRLLVIVLCLRAAQDTLTRALHSAQFQELELPSHLTGAPDEAIKQIDAQAHASRDAVSALDAERAALAQRLVPELQRLRAAVERARLLTEARGLMGHSERVSLISGWVPAIVSPQLEAAVRQAVGNRCVLRWQDAGGLEDVRRGRIPVPILMHNPVLIRPFERVLQAYGLPRYGEIDPTAVVALGFLSMFGFMFGDVGQGAVLFAAGYFIYRRMFRYRDYAVILMECGVFAIAFGFLYGSVFGVERWLPALWLRPLDDMATLMKTAIGFGAAFLSAGLVINTINAVRRRDLAALWERNGVLAALAYWIAIGLCMRRIVSGPNAVTAGTAMSWLALPLTLILLKEPARALWTGWRSGTRPQAAELFALIVESLVDVLDTVISTVSNTATFIRLAAFALSHAGLFLATFSIADAVSRSAAGAVGAGVVVVLGNLMIIALEGLIVSIQSIRLEYYEFFSKFYSGSGEAYRPLRFGAALPHQV